jgi:predicted dehydrogenase
MNDIIRLGVVGAAGRGGHFKRACEGIAGLRVQAVCDLNADQLENARQALGAAEKFTDYDTMLARADINAGLFGQPYYAEGEYLHELKGLNEITKWRRKWQTGINGITYGTHSLGPILQWLRGDRVTAVCCAGSGHHYRDPRGDQYEAEDTSVMLGRLASGGLVKIRVDMLSDRPHAMMNYQLQGSDGAYESARAPGETDRIWLRAVSKNAHTWTPLTELGDDYLPDWYRENRVLAEKTGHAGGDFYVLLDFVNAITGKKLCPIGIHEAMDMTLPGLISQQSIQQNSAWLPMPDSRTW